MSAQYPEDPNGRALGPQWANEPIDPYGDNRDQHPVSPPPPPPPARHAPPAYPAQAPQGYPQQRYPQQGYPQYGYQTYAVAPKSPALALLASFFIPGLGSMLNGDVGKGIGILVGFVISSVLTVIVIGFVGMLAFWIWGMADGYSGAQQWNARHGILS